MFEGRWSDLFPFQKTGVKFLTSKPHSLLGDEMGLGKSVQVCVALMQKFIGAELRQPEMVLIICPAHLKETWRQYLLDWTDFTAEQIEVVESTQHQLKPRQGKWAVIVNYEALTENKDAATRARNKAAGKRSRKRISNVAAQINALFFDVGVIDECQRLRGLRSGISKLLLSLQGRRQPLLARCTYKWFLSGCLAPNGRPIEFYPILRTCAPDVLGEQQDLDTFGRYFCNGFTDEYNQPNYNGASNIDEFTERLKPFMLRREMADVYKELPDKVVHPIYCKFTKPLPVDKTNTPIATLRRFVGLAKVPFSVQFLKDTLTNEPEEKIVCFAYSREVIEKLADHTELAKFNPVYIYGGMSPKDKAFAKKTFESDPTCRLIILQITSAGTGTDGLQRVARIICFAELEWSAGDFEQACARLHRIGQLNLTRIYPIIARGTLDESMINVYHKKIRNIKTILKTNEHQLGEFMSDFQNLADSINRLCVILEKQGGVTETKVTNIAEKQAEKKATAATKAEPAKKVLADTSKTPPANSPQERLQDTLLKVIRTCPGGKDEGKADIKAVLSACGVTPPKSENVTEDQYEAVLQGLEKKLLIYSTPPADESDDLDAV